MVECIIKAYKVWIFSETQIQSEKVHLTALKLFDFHTNIRIVYHERTNLGAMCWIQ